MPVFEYKGFTDAGKAVTGGRDAESAKALRALLRKDGVFLTDVVAEKKGAGAVGAAGTTKDIRLRQFFVGRRRGVAQQFEEQLEIGQVLDGVGKALAR